MTCADSVPLNDDKENEEVDEAVNFGDHPTPQLGILNTPKLVGISDAFDLRVLDSHDMRYSKIKKVYEKKSSNRMYEICGVFRF